MGVEGFRHHFRQRDFHHLSTRLAASRDGAFHQRQRLRRCFGGRRAKGESKARRARQLGFGIAVIAPRHCAHGKRAIGD